MRYGAFSLVPHVSFPCAACGPCLPRSVALWREPGLRGRCGVFHHGRCLRGAARGCARALVTRLLYTSTTSTTTEQTPTSKCLWKWYVLGLYGVCCLYAPALPTCWFSPLSLCVRGPNLDSFLSPSVRGNAGPGTLAHCPVVASWEQCGASSVFTEVVWFKYVFPVLNSLSTRGSSARFVIPRVRGAQYSVCVRQLGGLRNSRSRWLLRLVRSSRGRDTISSSSSTLTPRCSCHMCGLRSWSSQASLATALEPDRRGPRREPSQRLAQCQAILELSPCGTCSGTSGEEQTFTIWNVHPPTRVRVRELSTWHAQRLPDS